MHPPSTHPQAGVVRSRKVTTRVCGSYHNLPLQSSLSSTDLERTITTRFQLPLDSEKEHRHQGDDCQIRVETYTETRPIDLWQNGMRHASSIGARDRGSEGGQ